MNRRDRDQAEVDILRLRAELAAANRRARAAENYVTITEAAIARVRELCDQWRDLPVEPPYMTTYQSIQEFIRHALDGSE